MIFSSFDFLFRFLPLFLILYFICPEKWRNQCLFAGSLIFYFYGARHSPLYFVLFLLSIPVNFFIGQLIGRKRDAKERSFWLNAGIFYNLFWLILYNGKLKPAPIIYKNRSAVSRHPPVPPPWNQLLHLSGHRLSGRCI